MELVGPTEETQHFRTGHVDIHQSQTGDGASEVGFVPDVLEGREPPGEVIQAPDVYPRENGQEKANFEGKNSKDKS
jgi:hypothetical protein